MDHKDMDAAKSGTRPYRLGAFVDGTGWVEHKYGRVFQHKDGKLLAAPDTDQIKLILRLVEDLDDCFCVSYLLLVPRDEDQDEGRFELTGTLDREGLAAFLKRYRELFEEDGRHHLLIACRDATILYDQHNVMVLSGPLAQFEAILRDAGLTEGDLVFPSPHSHHYHDELDSVVDDMLERYEWKWYPLDSRTD